MGLNYSEMDNNKEQQKEEQLQDDQNQQEDQKQNETTEMTDQEKIEELENKVKEKEDAFLRLYAEFDNFRKRSAKERIEQSKLAGRDVIMDFLPVLDDINRAQATIDSAESLDGVKEGIELIINKLWTTLSNKGLSVMEVIGEEFDSEIHEAITEIPAQNEDMKGKVVDQVEKGYKLNDVIIRYPKVVVGK